MASLISSTALLAANEDLITEILLLLPAKNVVRLKLVSERWLSLISDHNFKLRHTRRNSNAISGLILMFRLVQEGTASKPRYAYVSLDENDESTEMPTKFIPFLEHHAPGSIEISDSCNGLFLCFLEKYEPYEFKLYVVNPTTHQFSNLPLPPAYGFNPVGFSLAYDPCKSSVYQVVYRVPISDSVCSIFIYSSETGVWELFPIPNLNLDGMVHVSSKGVFWKGAIVWVDNNGYSHLFDVNQKCMQKLPKPPLPDSWSIRYLKYFGESRGNLYFISVDGHRLSKFIVYELHKDCSGWFVKCSLDVNDILAAFPELNRYRECYSLRMVLGIFIWVLLLVEDEDEGTKVVMSIAGKVISYSFKDNTFKSLRDIHHSFATCSAFKYHETLSCV